MSLVSVLKTINLSRNESYLVICHVLATNSNTIWFSKQSNF